MKSAKRKIHIELTEETHKRLRIKAAIQDVSMQQLVEELISESVAGVAITTLQEQQTDKKLT